MRYTVTFTEEQYAQLVAHIFRECDDKNNRNERAAYLLCGISRTGAEARLLVRQVIPIRDSSLLVQSSNRFSIPSSSFLPSLKINGQLPPSNFNRVVNPQTGGTAQGGAFYVLLPYYEEGSVFKTYTTNRPDAGYLGAQYVPLVEHVCPSDTTQSHGVSTLDGKSATGNYSCNLCSSGPTALGTRPTGAFPVPIGQDSRRGLAT